MIEDEDLHLEWSNTGRDTVNVYQEMKTPGKVNMDLFIKF